VVTHSIPNKHFIGELGLQHWVDDITSYGKAEITPDMLVPGTGFARIGLLATLADVVSGQPPTGVITPTTDLSVHIGRLVEMKTVHLEARVIKAGATLAVVKSLLRADEDVDPFATSLATFMNRRLELTAPLHPHAQKLSEPLHTRIGARTICPGTVELDPKSDIANTFHCTVQGGVLALLAELAAESAVEENEPFVATDLDIRYLNRVKVGPIAAEAEVLMVGPTGRVLGVHIFDRGEDQRLVAYASISGRVIS
jgi:uncharacterized protein (TIGR00369 family)